MFKVASMVDEHTRESLMDLTDRSITGEDFVAALDTIIDQRGAAPMLIRLDNGPELVSQALRDYCDQRIGLHYIPPGAAVEMGVPPRSGGGGGYTESSNNRCRDECLNLHEFDDLIKAKIAITDQKTSYNKGHQHSRLNHRTPAEYADHCKCTHRPSN